MKWRWASAIGALSGALLALGALFWIVLSIVSPVSKSSDTGDGDIQKRPDLLLKEAHLQEYSGGMPFAHLDADTLAYFNSEHRQRATLVQFSAESREDHRVTGQADVLTYDGQSRRAHLSGNVELNSEAPTFQMMTDSLSFLAEKRIFSCDKSRYVHLLVGTAQLSGMSCFGDFSAGSLVVSGHATGSF